jgi:hypothetical protein
MRIPPDARVLQAAFQPSGCGLRRLNSTIEHFDRVVGLVGDGPLMRSRVPRYTTTATDVDAVLLRVSGIHLRPVTWRELHASGSDTGNGQQ